ncbi:hypothetical protein MLD38_016149 [Melastoma candidum]|uniref:Uncharacterized protein n=1 Tax=Melastoma candidum TaxID=119954 RepID=A0ACB9RM52_9MYRT|nr:hypothetical protein MLD38_016149 [Melastoma candidum]
MACNNRLHFILVPLMCPGHLLPMVDLARILAGRGVAVTLVTTPANADRFRSTILRAVHSGLDIRLHEIVFPSSDFGLPEGCENIDALPSMDLMMNFLNAARTLRDPLGKFIEQVSPRPAGVISDKYLDWTAEVALNSGIPRILFDGMSCLTQVCTHNLLVSKAHEGLSGSAVVVIPGLPKNLEFRKSQLPGILNPGKNPDWQKAREEIFALAEGAYGMIVNTFEGLESDYVKSLKEMKGGKVWCVGPLSLCNKDVVDMVERGSKKSAACNEHLLPLMSWLDSQAENSVLYVCLGSLNRLLPEQMKELGFGLEASGRPFIWVIRGANKGEEFEEWLREGGYEERVSGRGFLIRGWAPQVLILSHRAVGGFLTHCGWNSSLEGISAGLPMVTWPLFAEQFFNEKVIVQISGVGVSVGAKLMIHLGEEEDHGVTITRDDVKDAVEEVMNEKGAVMRDRAKKLGEMARKALVTSGSSYNDLTMFLQDMAKDP